MRHQMRPLRFYSAEWSAVIGGQLDVWRRIGNEGMPVRLLQGEPGQTGSTLEPQTAQPFRTGFSALDSSPTVSSKMAVPVEVQMAGTNNARACCENSCSRLVLCIGRGRRAS